MKDPGEDAEGGGTTGGSSGGSTTTTPTTTPTTPTTTSAETTDAPTTGDSGSDSESAGQSCGAPGQVRWIRQFDTASHTGYNGMSLAVDGAGNVILVAQFSGEANVGGETFVAVDQWVDSYVAKFDPEGGHLWSRHIGGEGGQRIDAVAVDDDGTIALGGEFSVSIDLGGGSLMAASVGDLVVANLTPDGEHVWSRAFTNSGLPDPGEITDIAVADGATVFVADMGDSSDFGGGPIGTPESSNSFAVKLDVAGEHVWSRAMGSGGPSAFYVSAVTIDGAGGVWVAGSFEKEGHFGDEPPVVFAQPSPYIARWTADGQPLGVLLPTNQLANDFPLMAAMGADTNGRVRVGGGFSGELEFGGELLVSSGSLDGFVVTLDGDGAPQWQRALGQSSFQILLDLAIDAAGRTAIVGDFESGIDFGGGVQLAGTPGFNDGYVAKLDVDGAPLWARRLGAAPMGNASEVGMDDAGAVYVAGSFLGTLAIDGFTLEVAESDVVHDYDTVLMKLCP